jgi:DNA polymerase-3 subunit gamma/tau
VAVADTVVKAENGHAAMESVSISAVPSKPNGEKPILKTSSKTTLKLTDLLKGKTISDQAVQVADTRPEENEPFTFEQLRLVWTDFAEQRKKFQAEYQLLLQPFEIREHLVVIHLLSPVQETMLNNFKSDLISYLREKLKNNTVLVAGELKETDEKQRLYTPRDKFDFLVEKNPVLRELKDRLGLDTDF